MVVRVVAERDEETEREAKQTGTNSWIAVRRRDVVVVRCLGVRRACVYESPVGALRLRFHPSLPALCHQQGPAIRRHAPKLSPPHTTAGRRVR